MDQFHNRFPVYDDVSSAGNHFPAFAKIPGPNAPVDIDGSDTSNPHSGATAIKNVFHGGAAFGGFYFLNGVLPPGETAPAPNFGTEPNAGIDLSGATALRFWARGETGHEVIDFFVGGVGRDADTGQFVEPFPDSTPRYPPLPHTFPLTTDWQVFDLDLTGLDLHYVLGGFGWVASAQDNPTGAVFYLDDIAYTLDPAHRASRLQEPRLIRSFTTEPFQVLPTPVGQFDLVLRNICSEDIHPVWCAGKTRAAPRRAADPGAVPRRRPAEWTRGTAGVREGARPGAERLLAPENETAFGRVREIGRGPRCGRRGRTGLRIRRHS